MERFEFFFGLHFGGQLHSHTDNLSKHLQGTKVAAVSGQGLALANLTKETLTKMPSDQSFDHFYANISRKSEGLLGKPTLLRKRCTSARLEVGAGTPSYSQTAKDHFRRVYYVLLILSSVLSIRKASAPTPRWRPSWLKLVMVTTMRQSSSFLKHHTEKMLIQGRYLGMQLSILEVML